MKPPFIYALVDPLKSDTVRYIGMTMVNAKRPYRHSEVARFKRISRSHTINWIRKLHSEGRDYQVIILEEFSESSSLEEVYKAEQGFIDAAKTAGMDLTNKSDGGPGVLGLKWTDESRALLRKTRAELSKDPVFKASLSAGQKRRYENPLEREKSSKIHKGRKISEITRVKIKEGLKKRREAGFPGSTKGKKQSEEHKEKTRQRMLGNIYTKDRKLSPEHIKRIVEATTGSKRSEEVKAVMSERKKADWANGVYSTEEYRNKQIASHLGKPSASKGKKRTEEQVREMKENQRKYHTKRGLDTEVSPTERLRRKLARQEKKLARLKAEAESE